MLLFTVDDGSNIKYEHVIRGVIGTAILNKVEVIAVQCERDIVTVSGSSLTTASQGCPYIWPSADDPFIWKKSTTNSDN